MSVKNNGCCGEDNPPSRELPPGLSRLVTHEPQPKILARMVSALPQTKVHALFGAPELAQSSPLRALSARSTDDGTIALLDAWACVCDVLSFYSERLLNEGYLTTAREEVSLVELARELGYQPSPGVAASVRLALTIDDATSDVVHVPAGLAVGSIPAPGQQPQTFETDASLAARAQWNELRPAQEQAQRLTSGQREIWLQGSALRLAKGDAVALLGEEIDPQPGHAAGPGDEHWDFRVVAKVEADAAKGVTRVELDRPLGDGWTTPSSRSPYAVVFRRRASLYGVHAPNAALMSFPEGVSRSTWIEDSTPNGRPHSEWKHFALSDDAAALRGEIDLDREVEGLLNHSWVVLQSGVNIELYRLAHATPRQRKEFGLAGKVTRLKLNRKAPLVGENLLTFERRSTTVYLDSEAMALGLAPRNDLVSGRFIALDRVIRDLPVGRAVTVIGHDVNGVAVIHETSVRTCSLDKSAPAGTPPRTMVELDSAAPVALVRSSMRILANVVAATHGTTVREVVGHGDAASANPRMNLRQGPLTWVAADNPSGRKSSLTVSIGGLAWEPTTTLLDHGPNDRVYQLSGQADGKASLVFGDGHHGARLPSGIENVQVQYRKGIGLAGEVGEHRLSVLAARPQGVRGVNNPRGPIGAADPESMTEIRRNANLRVATLDRLVSVQDYEDFARAFAGIGKAQAVELWDGKRTLVHLCVASASGSALPDDAPIMRRLAAAITQYADPAHVASIGSYVEVRFAVDVAVLRESGRDKLELQKAIESALLSTFTFAERSFGQSVSAAEVTAVISRVPGVVAIDLDALYVGATASLQTRLVAQPPRWLGTGVSPAQLVVADPTQITVRWLES